MIEFIYKNYFFLNEKGMSHLAAILLLFLAEYDAFCCLINLTHSHHFLSFLRGDMREVFYENKL